MRTIKEEVDVSEYEGYTDANRKLGRFLEEVYMGKRMHSSLSYLTPVEFEQRWLAHVSQGDFVESPSDGVHCVNTIHDAVARTGGKQP